MKQEDFAQQIELEEWEANQKKGRLPEPTKKSALRCTEPGCRVRIPKERRKAIPGVQFCVECQEWNEYMKGRNASKR